MVVRLRSVISVISLSNNPFQFRKNPFLGVHNRYNYILVRLTFLTYA